MECGEADRWSFDYRVEVRILGGQVRQPDLRGESKGGRPTPPPVPGTRARTSARPGPHRPTDRGPPGPGHRDPRPARGDPRPGRGDRGAGGARGLRHKGKQAGDRDRGQAPGTAPRPRRRARRPQETRATGPEAATGAPAVAPGAGAGLQREGAVPPHTPASSPRAGLAAGSATGQVAQSDRPATARTASGLRDSCLTGTTSSVTATSRPIPVETQGGGVVR